MDGTGRRVLRVEAMRTAKVRALDGRWRSWAPSWLACSSPVASDATPARGTTRAMALRPRTGISRDDLKKRIATAALVFRGYDLTNLGRAPEFLEHRAYGPVVRAILDSASVLCGDVLGKKVDLAARILAARTVHARDLRSRYRHDRRHGAGPDPAARRVFRRPGSAGAAELRPQHRRAVGAGRRRHVHDGATPADPAGPGDRLRRADRQHHDGDSVDSGRHPLQIEDVQHLCSTISSRGQGLIGPSTYLSPYQVLLLGQGDTLDLLEQEMREYLPAGVTLRRKPNHWPPLHTPLVWERNIPNRTADDDVSHGRRAAQTDAERRLMHHGSGQLRRVEQPGDSGRLDRSSPVRDAMEHTLASGAELVIHVGPEPKLLTTCFDRLSHKIMKQLKMRHLDRLGSSVIPSNT